MFANDRWTPTAKSDAPVTKKQAVTTSCLGVGGYNHNTICLCLCFGSTTPLCLAAFSGGLGLFIHEVGTSFIGPKFGFTNLRFYFIFYF
jgi:hypothetical protein